MSAELSERVGKVVGYPPLSELSATQRREFHEALLEAERFEDLPGKSQAGDRSGEPTPVKRERSRHGPRKAIASWLRRDLARRTQRVRRFLHQESEEASRTSTA